MSAEIEIMKCDWCGKEFQADARACVEAGIDCVEPDEEAEAGEEWKNADAPAVPLDHTEIDQSERERIKAELGISDAEFDKLITTGTVDGLGAIVCLDCQEAGTECDDEDETE